MRRRPGGPQPSSDHTAGQTDSTNGLPATPSQPARRKTSARVPRTLFDPLTGIDWQRHAGDVTRFVRGEPNERVRNVNRVDPRDWQEGQSLETCRKGLIRSQ